MWRVLTSSSESGESVNQGSSGSITSTKHTIEGLQHESVYNITVTVNTAGSGSFSQYVITFTGGLEFINAGFTFTFQHSSRMRVRYPRRACARVTVVCLSVYPSVPALAASASVETSKQRYSRVSLRLFLD